MLLFGYRTVTQKLYNGYTFVKRMPGGSKKVNSIIVLGTKTKEGKTLKTLLVTAMVAALISVFGLVPSSVVFAEEDAATDGVAGIGDVQYASLQEAIDNAQDSDTITLLKDTAENAVINDEGMTLTIDLGGHKIAPADGKEPTIYVDNAKDVTIKNGEVTGNNTDDRYVGAFHILSKTATIDNVDFHDNRACLTAFFAATMVDGNDFQDRNITITNCKFHDSGARDGEKAYPAVCVNGYSTKIDNCSFYKNDRSLELYSQTPNNDVEVNYSIRNTRFSNNSGQTIDAGVPAGGGMDMYNVYINDNKLSGGDNAVAYFHGVGTGNSEGASTTMNWCKIYGNSGAKHTILTDTPGSLSMYGCTIEENTAEETGAICAMQGYVIMNQYAVIRNNSATGSSETTCGGITLLSYIGQTYVGTPGEDGHYETSGDPASIRVYGGALYGNRSENAEYKATDLYVGSKAYSVANVTPEQFAGHASWNPIDRDMTDHKWIEQVSDTEEDELTMYSKKVRVYTVDKGDEEAKAARAAQKASKYVYIDGVKGNDEGYGTIDDPVMTLDRAKALADEIGSDTIIVLDTITLKDAGETTVDMNGITLLRSEEFTNKSLITISGNSSVTLKNTVLDGKLAEDINATASLITVNKKSALILDEGAKLQNNGTSTGEKRFFAGGIDVEGSLTIMDGAEITNNSGTMAGGILVNGGSLVMDGGKISGNTSKKLSNGNADYCHGGGVTLYRGGSMVMNDGIISDNKSDRSGGGVSLGNTTTESVSKGYGTITFEMNGGTISNNYAKYSGGGVFVQCNTEATISGGNINENRAGGTSAYFAGGGIYVNGYHNKFEEAVGIVHGKLFLTNVEIAENTSSQAGGAIAVCGSGHGNVSNINGTVIHDNKGADGIDVFFDSFVYVYNYTTGGWSGYTPFILPYESFVSDRMLNGAPYNWTNSKGDPISKERLRKLNRGLSMKTSVTAEDPDVKESIEMATVHINGNYSGTKGGGIGCNGELYIGKMPQLIDVNVEKKWDDADHEGERPATIKVDLYRDGELYDTCKIVAGSDGDWKATFSKLPKFRLDEDGQETNEPYEYTIEEDMSYVPAEGADAVGAAYDAKIVQGEDGWEITNTYVQWKLRVMKNWEVVSEEDIPEEISVNLLLNGEKVDTLKLTKDTGWTGQFEGLDWAELSKGNYSIEEDPLEGFAAIYGEITKSEEEAGLYIVELTNSREPEVKEEIEPPETPEEGEVKGAVEEPEETATGEVKGDIENPTRSGSRTGDNVKLGAIIALLVAAAAACVVIFARRRRG